MAYHTFELHAGMKHDLRKEALCEAYKMQYRDMYRHMMRYEASEYREVLQLTQEECDTFEAFENKETESSQECRYVVVNLPREEYEQDPQWYLQRATKCSHKTYVGRCWYAIEMGENGVHPHVNFFFYKTVKWLARSRIITEFSQSFQVEKNFTKVKSMGKHAVESIKGYISKEGVHIYDNFSPLKDGAKKLKNKKNNLLLE